MLKLANRARSQLAAGINDDSVTITIVSGHEGRFPSLAPGDWFPVTVVDAANNVENMRCTARSGVNLTVVRGQEGTAPRSFDAGASVSIRLTAAALDEATELPDRLKPTAPLVVDADTLNATGPYRTDAETTGRPADASGFLFHAELSSVTAVQEWQHAGDEAVRHLRLRVAGVWGDWNRLLVDRAALDERYLRKAVGGALEGPLTTVASAAGAAGLSMPQGVTPTDPGDGDVWTTAAGLFVRIAGATWALARRGANTFTGRQTLPASTSEAAAFNLPHGENPADPEDGDVWTSEDEGLMFCAAGTARRVIHDGDVHTTLVWNAGAGGAPALITPAQFHAAVRAAVAAIPFNAIGSTALLGRITGTVMQGEVYPAAELRWASTQHVSTGSLPANSEWLATGPALAGGATTFRRVA